MQLSQARANASEAFRRAEIVYESAALYLNRTKSLINEGNQLIQNLTGILQNNTASPSEIKKLAEEVMHLMQCLNILRNTH